VTVTRELDRDGSTRSRGGTSLVSLRYASQLRPLSARSVRA
jgi:hypothetical protein